MDRQAEILSEINPFFRRGGQTTGRSPWTYSSRRILDYLFLYLKAGKVVGELDGCSFQMNAGDLLWIPPGQWHELKGLPPGSSYIWAHIDLVYAPERSHWDLSVPAAAEPFWTDHQYRLHPPVSCEAAKALHGVLQLPNHERIGLLLEEVLDEKLNGNAFSALAMRGLLLQMLAEVWRGLAGGLQAGSEYLPRLEDAARRLRSDFRHEIAIAELARGCRLSGTHFRNLFSRFFDCTPGKYRKRARLRLARNLMITTDMTLSQIAEEVGFTTVHSFSKAFKTEFAVSPARFRHDTLSRG